MTPWFRDSVIPWLRDSGTPGLRDFSFILSSTFIYEPIIIKIVMNTHNMKTQFFFIKWSMTLKVIQGHIRPPFEGELLLTVSLLPSPSLTLSLCLSIFSLSLILLLSFSFSTPPPHPYICLISTLCLSIFSLFLVLSFLP